MSFELREPKTYTTAAWKYVQRAAEEEDPDNPLIALTFAIIGLTAAITRAPAPVINNTVTRRIPPPPPRRED